MHGYAVAWGLVCELYLSYIKTGFPKDKIRQTIQFVKENYGSFTFNCKEYHQLYELMKHDKKNTAGVINFTLLKEVGDICLNQTADKETIFEMFELHRECMEHRPPGKERHSEFFHIHRSLLPRKVLRIIFHPNWASSGIPVFPSACSFRSVSGRNIS